MKLFKMGIVYNLNIKKEIESYLNNSNIFF